MNFKTYLAILEDEGLKESPLADGILMQAMEAQRQIAVYQKYERTAPIDKELKKLEEKKLKCIWEAVDMARMNPPDSDMYKLTLRGFNRVNKREYKGFLNEYQIMQHKINIGEAVVSQSKLTDVEQRVSDRWKEAMERMEQ